jgi:hypothetical protein
MKGKWVLPVVLVAGLAGLGGMTIAASAQDSGPGYSRDDDSPRWRRGDRGYDSDRGPRWRDDDRRGSRHGCGGRGDGYGHHGRGYGRDDDGYRRHGYHDRGERGYGRHGWHHRHEGRRHEGHGPRQFGRAFDPARLDGVKKELGITAAQEQAWTKYTSTLKEVADARKARRDSFDRSAVAKMSVDEFRKFRDTAIQQHRKEQDSVNAAVDGLVKSLDEKQQAVAKEVLPGFAQGGFMRGMAGGPKGHYR